MKYYFRVNEGFERYITTEGVENLLRAKIAMATGKVFNCDTGTIAGNHITSIIPDYNREMGYYPEYELGSEDWLEITEAKADRKYRDIFTRVDEQVREYLSSGKKPDLVKLSQPKEETLYGSLTNVLASKFTSLNTPQAPTTNETEENEESIIINPNTP